MTMYMYMYFSLTYLIRFRIRWIHTTTGSTPNTRVRSRTSIIVILPHLQSDKPFRESMKLCNILIPYITTTMITLVSLATTWHYYIQLYYLSRVNNNHPAISKHVTMYNVCWNVLKMESSHGGLNTNIQNVHASTIALYNKFNAHPYATIQALEQRKRRQWGRVFYSELNKCNTKSRRHDKPVKVE